LNLCKHTKFLALIKVNSHNEIIDIKCQDITLYLKREDLIHPNISGNKYRKLKYNIQEALTQNHDSLLTFGGAYSNHVAAVAYAGSICGLKTIGIIRGDELASEILNNPTLTFAQCHGMQFKFISRSSYREKMTNIFLEELKNQFNNFYLIPEGGTNALAVKGCEEILTDDDRQFDYICCSLGTGGTISGLINAAKPYQTILGFSALKGHFLKNDIRKFVTTSNWKILNEYDFGGYAKINHELVNFMNKFKRDHQILLDPIYTSKMMFGVFDLIKHNYFPKGSKILAIHTGGTQGIDGMNLKLKRKNWPLILK
jgi:1-aminocyclopropane-1-carboxylate deaminase